MPHAAPRSAGALAAALSLVFVLASTALAGASGARRLDGRRAPVHIRGTAYTFDNQRPIAGATIRVAELPRVSATSGADGGYDIAVPDGTKVTPYVAAAGHRSVHLQTFVTVGRDLERVNFQVPTRGAYSALAALLGTALDADGKLVRCAIVSTFANANVRELSFPDFVAFGAHGVAGATAATEPARPSPVYFNESVIPDRSRTESSIDGGVIWAEVPEGVYRIRGRHPTRRFAEFVASCEPGRVVNANPPQGLYQLRAGETVDRGVDATATSVRLERRGLALRVRVQAGEYVALGATLLRRGRRLAGRTTGDRVGAFAPGRRSLSLAIPRGTGAGALELRILLEDAVGNRRLFRKRLRLP